MSFSLNVTQQCLFILRKIAEEQNYQRAHKIDFRILKQTHDINLSKNFSPITKELEEFNESTENLAEVFEKFNSETGNNQEKVPVEIDSDDGNDSNANIRTLANSRFSIPTTETLGSLKKSQK